MWAQARQLQVPLTGPQLNAIQILVEELRGSKSGLSVSELSRRMGLAHSTVSGIVDRLQQREIVRRASRRDDRRFAFVELTPPVQEWLAKELPATRLGPLATAMDKASAEQREEMVRGLQTLRRLLEDTAAGG